MDTKMLLPRFLVGMRDHFGDVERGTLMYKVFLNALVATSWKAFTIDIAVKPRDIIKLHHNMYSVISHSVVASEYLTDCHPALFFQQDTLVF